jgi:lipopolysaccharide transport system ATP-binding protein
MTGRENIYLNGAILGMRKKEIDRKLAEIIDFSGVEKYVDTPVKRYSSGMYVRLAFAVAAHLEPEILIVDEVLAVGDAQFQKKCLGKMEDVSKNQGRTVLFVSHQMSAIETLTNKAFYLQNGKLKSVGNTPEIINYYLHDYEENTEIKNYKQRSGNGKAKVVKVEVLKNGEKNKAIKQGEEFTVLIGIESKEKLQMDISFVLENFKEQSIYCTQLSDKTQAIVNDGYVEVEIPVPMTCLRNGDYLFSMAVFRPDKSEFYDTVLHFPLINIEGMADIGSFPIDARWGDLYFPIEWKINSK